MYNLERIQSIADMVRVGAETRGTKAALISGDTVTTFAQLDRRASKVANGLMATGIKPNDRVAYIGKNTDSYFEILFGALKARAVLVGVNSRLAGPEIAYILNDAQCKIIFVGEEFVDVIESIRDQVPTLRTIIALEGAHDAWPSYETWRFGQSDTDPHLPTAPDDDIIQLYTSGTTGHPKGVQLTNQNYLDLLQSGVNAGYAEWEEDDVNFVCMPLFHVAGVNIGVMGIGQGCTNIILRDVDPNVILELIEKHKITKMFVVPAVINFLLLMPDAKTRDLSSLETIMYGASPIAEDTIVAAKDLFKCDFIQVYGMTETAGGGTYLPPDDHDPARGKLRSCGIAPEGIQIKVVDGDGKAMGPGEVGEILIKGGMVMKGYWNRPEATAKSVIDGWMYTGDAGYLDKDGYLFIYDRVKDMIVSGGENIYPAEVENALFAHPAVADAAVIGVPDETWGEAVKGIVVLKEGVEATSDEIRSFVRERIAGYKVPKSIDFVDMLPRNPSGKVLRRSLREAYWEGIDRQVN